MYPPLQHITIIVLILLLSGRLHCALEESEEEVEAEDKKKDGDKEKWIEIEAEEALEIFDVLRDELIVTQMLAAIYADDTEAFSALLSKYGSNYVNATTTINHRAHSGIPSKNGKVKVPIIIVAVLYARLDIVQLLLQQGAALNANIENGYSALDYAIRLGYVELAEWLLDRDAKSALEHGHKVTPLHFAASMGNTAMMEMLLRRGIWDVNVRDPIALATPLHVASGQEDRGAEIKQSQSEFHEYLDRGNIVNLPPNPADANDALGVVKLLIDAGADVNLLDNDDLGAVTHAMKNGRLDIAKLLVQGGADPLLWDGPDSVDFLPRKESRKYLRKLSELAERQGYGKEKSGMLKYLQHFEFLFEDWEETKAELAARKEKEKDEL